MALTYLMALTIPSAAWSIREMLRIASLREDYKRILSREGLISDRMMLIRWTLKEDFREFQYDDAMYHPDKSVTFISRHGGI